MVKLIKVNYRVGESGLGSLIEGDIVDAYLLKSSETNFSHRFVYHPEDPEREIAENIDICYWHVDDEVWTPVDETSYLNLE